MTSSTDFSFGTTSSTDDFSFGTTSSTDDFSFRIKVSTNGGLFRQLDSAYEISLITEALRLDPD